jgi:hypothetical protein
LAVLQVQLLLDGAIGDPADSPRSMKPWNSKSGTSRTPVSNATRPAAAKVSRASKSSLSVGKAVSKVVRRVAKNRPAVTRTAAGSDRQSPLAHQARTVFVDVGTAGCPIQQAKESEMQQRDYSNRQRGGYQNDDRFGDYGRREQQQQGGQRGMAGGDYGDVSREQGYSQDRAGGQDWGDDRSSYGQYGGGQAGGRQQDAWDTGGRGASGQYGGQYRGDYERQQGGRYGSPGRSQTSQYSRPDDQFGRGDFGGGSMTGVAGPERYERQGREESWSGQDQWGSPRHDQGLGHGSRGQSQGEWGGSRQEEFDPDYHQWRNEQIRALDEDYRGWRQDRYKKFSDEFDKWRSNRTRGTSAGGSTDGDAGSNATSTGGTASSGTTSSGAGTSSATTTGTRK